MAPVGTGTASARQHSVCRRWPAWQAIGRNGYQAITIFC